MLRPGQFARVKARVKVVKAGPKIKHFWLIKEGLKPGGKVVYEGLQKVKDGAVVNPIIKEIELPNEENK